MRYSVNDPVGVQDIAWRLGYEAPTVSNWIKRHADFPKPLFRVSNGRIPVWEWATVRTWVVTTGHLNNHKKKAS